MIAGLLVALSLWGIGDQLLDFIITIRVGSLLQDTGGLSLANQPVVDMSILDALSMSLGMYWMIPTLAFAIATMSGYAANSIMGGIGASVMSGVGAAASEAAMGSRSMGVVRENMINTNKYDAARNDNMGVYTSVKHGLDQQTVNNNSTQMNTTMEGVEGGLNWKTHNDKRTGEGYDKSGNFTSMTQYKGADGEWHNQEVKTTYGKDGVDIANDRGGQIHLGKGATSTQYADGTTSYSGVSGKHGKVEAIYGADGNVGMVNGMKGHEFFNKHNSINEDMFTNRTNVSSEYTGEMILNGEKAFGRYAYDKDANQGVFSGQIGGNKVDMTLDNVKDFKIDNRGEQNSLAHVGGDVGQMSVNGSKRNISGTSVENLGNVHSYNADSIYQNGIKAHRDGNGEYAVLAHDYENLKHLKTYADSNPENMKAKKLYAEAANDFTSKASGFVNATSGAVQKEFSSDKAFNQQYQFGKSHGENETLEKSWIANLTSKAGLNIGFKSGDSNVSAGVGADFTKQVKLTNSESSQNQFGNTQSGSASIRDNVVMNKVGTTFIDSLEKGAFAEDFYKNVGDRNNYIPKK